jgi:hypothetical protein
MKNSLSRLLFLLAIAFVVTSCEKGGGSLSSQYGQHKSHNHGQVCGDCHGTGGGNDYWWKVAGSIYKPDLVNYNPNTTVYFYKGKGPDGVLVKTIEVDGNGNLFTTDNFSTTDSLYIALQSTTGEVKYMPDPTNDFNCNHCHDGVTNPRIWIK